MAQQATDFKNTIQHIDECAMNLQQQLQQVQPSPLQAPAQESVLPGLAAPQPAVQREKIVAATRSIQ
eukprot:2857950-Karenia_brevis.AAC.1